MKDIFVYSRAAISALDSRPQKHVIVSINCPGEEPASIKTGPGTLGRVDLFFWDLDRVPVDPVLGDQIKEEHLCQPVDAQRIIDLIEAHPEVEQVMVHCTAGKSRSAAVAAALHRICNGEDSIIFNDARYRPNMRVYRMILDEWYRRHPET